MSDTRRRKTRRSRLSRRRFFKGAGAAATVVTTGFGINAFAADGQPKVDENDAMAKALNYIHDARTVDAAKRLSDRYCNNCVLFDGSAEDEWGGCSIFPGKVVAGAGWCSAWAPKADQ